MTYNLCFDYVAIAILLLLFVVFRGRRKASLPIYGAYYMLVTTMMFAAILDVVTIFLKSYSQNIDLEVIYGCNVVYLMFQCLIIAGYALYLLCMVRTEIKVGMLWRMILSVPYVLICIIVITSQWTHMIFYYDSNMVYHEGMFYELLYLEMAYYTCICIFLVIRYKTTMGISKAFYALAALLFVELAQLVQATVPQYRIFSFTAAVCMISIIYTLQRPEEFFDSSNAILKKYLVDKAKLDYEHDIHFYMLFFRIHDYDILADSFGQREIDRMMRTMTSFLISLRQDAMVFRADKNIFAFRTKQKTESEIDELIEEIRERFSQPWKSGDVEAVLPVSYVSVSCPEEVMTFTKFKRLVNNIGKIDMDIYAIVPARNLIMDDKNEEILEAIHHAVENDSFEVYYQPIYSTEKKKIVAAEALIRLFDPVMGFIPPETMISLAEKEGYILKIGKYVFTEVCRFYTENRLDKLGIEYIEVNLSAVQCMQHRLAEEFIEIMKDFNIATNQINFEITETSAMISNSAVYRNISHFELHGVTLSLDDYGTGYSNISYLYHLPFRFIKIDKSILWSSETNEKAETTLKNIFVMSKKLDMRVVMEGVETEEQIKKLLKLKCDYFQGYYFSKPVKGAEFIDYVEHFELPEVCKDEGETK